MMYPFLTLNDETEITFSEPLSGAKTSANPTGEVFKVSIETPVENGFKSATCMLPSFLWENHGYTYLELEYLKGWVNSSAQVLMDLSRDYASKGGPESA